MEGLASAKAPDPGFVADLRVAFSGWRVAPLLPILTVCLSLPWLVNARGFASLFTSLFVALIAIGWPGVERVWYARLFAGADLRVRDLPRLWRAFFWRYARLGILVAIPLWIVLAVFGMAVDGSAPRDTTWLTAALLTFGLVADLLGTFVAPALAFTTDAVFAAIRVGLGMIRMAWPACALYVLVPPVVLEVVSVRWVSPLPARAAVVTLSTLLALAFKGATARFYLRRHETGPYGAVPPSADAPPVRPDVV